MGKTIAIYAPDSLPQKLVIEEFEHLDEHNVRFKVVEKRDGKVTTYYITTNLPYYYQEAIEHTGNITI